MTDSNHMDSAEFLSRFGDLLPEDNYVEKGELTEPVGLYAIREYPAHTGMPREYVGLIHLGHYSGEIFCSIDPHFRREYQHASRDTKRDIRSRLPRIRPLDLRNEGNYWLSDDQLQIVDKRGREVRADQLIAEQWELHIAPFSGIRFYLHLLKRGLYRLLGIVPRHLLWIVKLLLKFSVVGGVKIRVSDSPIPDFDSTSYQESAPEYTNPSVDTQQIAPLSLGISVQKVTIPIWALGIVIAYFSRRHFPTEFRGVMNKTLPATAAGVLTLLFTDQVIVRAIRWVFVRPLYASYRYLHKVAFLSRFWGANIRKLGPVFW